MKLMAAGGIFSAAITGPPSFSRSSSSTRTIIRPAFSSSIASGIVQNGILLFYGPKGFEPNRPRETGEDRPRFGPACCRSSGQRPDHRGFVFAIGVRWKASSVEVGRLPQREIHVVQAVGGPAFPGGNRGCV